MSIIFMILPILIFLILWILFINRFLPSGLVSKNNNDNKYDERQSKIFTEVLARTCIWLVYSMLWNLILKVIGFMSVSIDISGIYNEILYLALAIIWAVISYILVKRKYTPKEDTYEE